MGIASECSIGVAEDPTSSITSDISFDMVSAFVNRVCDDGRLGNGPAVLEGCCRSMRGRFLVVEMFWEPRFKGLSRCKGSLKC